MLDPLFKPAIIEKPSRLYVDASPIHGRGVFTSETIPAGSIIEKAPLVLINKEDKELLKQTTLYHFYFVVQDLKTPVALGLGYSSLYNHACPSNAAYQIDLRRCIIIIKACELIEAKQEITINYHGDPQDASPVVFNNPPGL